MAPPHILNWLKQAAANYVYPNETIATIASALDGYASLKIKTDQYTFDDGRTLLLLCLHGTLPITYAAARYNVPIAVWLPLDSPRSPPMVYVVPTSGMLVRKGKGVELDGRVNEDDWEYLRGWRRKWEAHSMLPLLQSLIDAFSLFPPVYAKPPTSTAASPSTSSAPARAQTSPMPSQAQPESPQASYRSRNGSEHLPHYTRPASSSGQPPPPPPPPPPPLPPIPGQSPPSRAYSQPAPLPQQQTFHPQQYGPPAPHPAGSPVHSQTQHARSLSYDTRTQGVPTIHPSYQPSQQQPQQPHHPHLQHPQYSSQTHSQQHQHHPGHMPRSAKMPPQHAIHQTQAPPQSPLRPPQLSSAAMPARPISQPPPPRQAIPDFLSADDDAPQSPAASLSQTLAVPPPPPPPNPETLLLHSTLHTALSSSLNKAMADITTRRAQLEQIKEDLSSAQPAIEDEMARLRAVRDVCRGVGERFSAIVGAGDERLAWLEARGEVGVDEVVCSTTIVYNQLVDLVAEDAAISDTIYQLNRALNTERIDLERFLKMTRILASDQFRCRALIEKILNG